MVRKFIRRKLYGRHFWRYAEFDELMELYTSNMFRAIANSLFSVFIPIYILKNGYSLTVVCLYYIGYFVIRFFADIACGFITARIGPKHTWILSHTFNVANLLSLLFLPSQPGLIIVSAITNALGTSFQFIPMYVNFSKIKSSKHSGREQGYFTTLENIGMAVGPIIGGVVAGWFGARYTIIFSIFFFVVSIAILLSSAESVRTRQKIKFRGLQIKKLHRDVISYTVRSIDMTVTASMWPVFMVLFVLTHHSYALLGLVTTVGLICAVLAAYIFGKLADARNSMLILRWSVLGESIISIARCFTRSFGGIALVSSLNQVSWTGMSLVYNKGIMAAADNLPGYRIAYFTWLESISEIFKLLIWAILAILTTILPDKSALQVIFVISAMAVLLVNLANFKTLHRR